MTEKQGTLFPWNAVDNLWCDHEVMLLEKKNGHRAKRKKSVLTLAISPKKFFFIIRSFP